MMGSIRWRHAPVLLLVMCASLLGLVGRASAHALLVSSSPPANAVLPEPPRSVVLTFSERVNLLDDSIRIVSGDGTTVVTGAPYHDGGSNTIAVDLPVLTKGTYVVAWTTLSVESHPITGGYVFSVGEAGKVKPDLLQDLLNSSRPAQRDQIGLGIGRSVAYGGLALLVGGLLMTAWCIPGQIAGRRVGVVLWLATAFGAVGTATMLASQASSAAGSWTAWDAVVRTDAGRWWLASLGAFAVSAALVVFRRCWRDWWWRVAAVLIGSALIAATAASGSALAGDMVVLGFVATCLHLIAMALLVGSVAVLAIGPDRSIAIAGRVAPIVLGLLGLLALTGTVSAWRESSSWEALTGSNYGHWLLVKVLIVVAAVVCGASTARWSAVAELDEAERGRRVRGALALQAVAIVGVLATTSGLVSSPPPAPVAPQAVVTVDVVEGTRLAQITLDPAVIGGTTMHVYISSATGALGQPQKITVNAQLPAQGLGPIDLQLQTAGPGHVTGSGVDFPFPGVWTINVVAHYADGDTTFTTRMEVR